MAIGDGQTPSNLKPIAASAPPPGVETPGYPQNPLKRVQEPISSTCFSRFKPIAWGFNPR
jgi:hypothetical protein